MTTAASNGLTNKNMMELFGVSHVTIFNWRKGTPQREKLPTVEVGGAIRYPIGKIKSWARQHGIAMLADPAELAGTGVLKPGPKHKPARKPTTGRQGTAKKAVMAMNGKHRKKA